MKKIKNLFRVCLLCLLLFCIKSYASSNFSGTITATVDGAVQNFNDAAMAVSVNAGGIQGMSITGVQGSSLSGVTIIITPSTGAVTSGTYIGSSSSNEVQFTYANVGTGVSYQNSAFSEGSNATVVITSISSTNIQGTFRATLVLQSGNGAATKTITNGSFNLPIQ